VAWVTNSVELIIVHKTSVIIRIRHRDKFPAFAATQPTTGKLTVYCSSFFSTVNLVIWQLDISTNMLEARRALKFFTTKDDIAQLHSNRPCPAIWFRLNASEPECAQCPRGHSQCRTMGNFVLPKKFSPPQTRLFAKSSVTHERSRCAAGYYSGFWVRTRPRKTPPFCPLEGGSLFLPKKRLAGGEQLAGTLQMSTCLDSGDDSQHG
jgi:hypothetical protein